MVPAMTMQSTDARGDNIFHHRSASDTAQRKMLSVFWPRSSSCAFLRDLLLNDSSFALWTIGRTEANQSTLSVCVLLHILLLSVVVLHLQNSKGFLFHLWSQCQNSCLYLYICLQLWVLCVVMNRIRILPLQVHCSHLLAFWLLVPLFCLSYLRVQL